MITDYEWRKHVNRQAQMITDYYNNNLIIINLYSAIINLQNFQLRSSHLSDNYYIIIFSCFAYAQTHKTILGGYITQNLSFSHQKAQFT